MIWNRDHVAQLKTRLEELWPSAKWSATAVSAIADSVRGFLPVRVLEALTVIYRSQERPQRPTPKEIRVVVEQLAAPEDRGSERDRLRRELAEIADRHGSAAVFTGPSGKVFRVTPENLFDVERREALPFGLLRDDQLRDALKRVRAALATADVTGEEEMPFAEYVRRCRAGEYGEDARKRLERVLGSRIGAALPPWVA